MDQVKVFLRQCVKYRFWIAVGISLLLPMVGYFIGADAITQATTLRTGEINKAKTDIGPYTSPNPPNDQYKPLVEAKKEVLSKEVDETHRRLFAIQEPLLKWPENVESKFRGWGRKWPENVDRGEVQKTLFDYTIAYPEFVSRVYATCNPWNPEDGTGVVLAPDEASLLRPAPFQPEAPPELGTVWAEQERLWVATALLDVVAKVNQSVGAKDWDGAAIKQILSIDVGSAIAEDQKSLAKGVVLDPAPLIAAPDGAAPAAAPADGGNPVAGAGPAGKTDEVYSLHAEGNPPYKILPIRMTVLVDQARLPDYLVALENSPMAIQVMEPDIGKPSVEVIRPVYGEIAANSGMGPSPGGPPSARGMRGGMPGYPGGGGKGGSAESEMRRGGGFGGPGGPGSAAAAPKKGIDLRSKDRAAERKAKEAAAKKTAVKKAPDQFLQHPGSDHLRAGSGSTTPRPRCPPVRPLDLGGHPGNLLRPSPRLRATRDPAKSATPETAPTTPKSEVAQDGCSDARVPPNRTPRRPELPVPTSPSRTLPRPTSAPPK